MQGRSPWTAGDFVGERAGVLASRDLVGPERRKALATITDRWMRQLFERSGAAGLGAALIAVGGFGRGELAPGSDLDLLLLHPPKTDIDQAAQGIWYPIWDAAIRLDHSTRTPAEARKLALTDLRVLLGLLDARLVAGNPELLRDVRRDVFSDWRSMAVKRLPELRVAVEERTGVHGELAHMLEPDLKESYGGLRDLTVLRAIDASWVADTGMSALSAPSRLLRDARDELHLETGRGTDRLVLQEQAAVAGRLGFADADTLLRAVCAAGRTIAFASDSAWHEVDRAIQRRRGARLRDRLRVRCEGPTRSPLAAGVVEQEGEAVLALDARPQEDPVLILRAAAAAAQAGIRLSQHSIERLAAESAPMPAPWPRSARDAFVSLLGAGRPTLPVWEALDQAGLIERLIPPWGAVRSAPQHNPVHRFTVDRHLIETAVIAAGLTRRVSRPDLLLVAALFHDIGKGTGRDHTEAGVELMSRLAPSLGFGPEDASILCRLVRYHLLLPQMATRRDLSDPATLAALEEAARTPDFLDLLHALTEADALASGPAAWSPWKASLVAELVERVRAAMAGSPMPPPKLSEQQLRLAEAPGVQVLLEPDGPVLRVTVAADDRVGLLAAVAGSLALNQLQVRSARTKTIGERAVTTWVVTPVFGAVPEAARLREDVRRALAGGVDLGARLRQRASSYRRQHRGPRPGPRVSIVPGASAGGTVVEVRAHDAPGLLFTIAAAIAGTGARIDAAHAETMGSDAVDVFYLAAPEGGPLPEPMAAEVSERISSELADQD